MLANMESYYEPNLISVLRHRLAGSTLSFNYEKVNHLDTIETYLPEQKSDYHTSFSGSPSIIPINGFEPFHITDQHISIQSFEPVFFICVELKHYPKSILTRIRMLKWFNYENYMDHDGNIQYIVKLDIEGRQKIVYKIGESKEIVSIRYMKHGKYEFSIDIKDNNTIIQIQNKGEGIDEKIKYMMDYMKKTKAPSIHPYTYKMPSRAPYGTYIRAKYISLNVDFTNSNIISAALMMKPHFDRIYDIIWSKYERDVRVQEYTKSRVLIRYIMIVNQSVVEEWISHADKTFHKTKLNDKISIAVYYGDAAYPGEYYQYSLDKKLLTINVVGETTAYKITVTGDSSVAVYGDTIPDADKIKFALGYGKEPEWPFEYM